MSSLAGFRSLSMLERPFTAAQIRAAADSALAGGPSPVETGYITAIQQSLAKYSLPGPAENPSAPRSRFDVEGYATAQTSGRRDLMLADTGTSVTPGGSMRVMLAGGPIAGSVRVLIDNRLNHDPEFGGRKDRKLAGRTQDAYLLGKWAYGEAFFGRTDRNWGPPMYPGLQVGDYAYSYDHFYGRIGSDRLHFSTVIAKLDTYRDVAGREFQRYFSIHRLAGRWNNWELAFTEGYVYGGVGRGLEFALINPLNVFALSWRDENVDGNLNLGVETAYRTKSFGTFAAHILVDDYQIDKCDTVCSEPSSLGYTFTAEGLPFVGGNHFFAAYTRINNLTYRTPRPDETYAINGLGLGRGFSDYDEFRVGSEIVNVPLIPLRLYFARRRQGEGDYRKPFPPKTAIGAKRIPAIFAGTTTTVNRVAVSGGGYLRNGFRISGDVGYNSVSTPRPLHDVDDSGFEGRLRIAFEPRWGLVF